jgi:hypothetical protein
MAWHRPWYELAKSGWIGLIIQKELALAAYLRKREVIDPKFVRIREAVAFSSLSHSGNSPFLSLVEF